MTKLVKWAVCLAISCSAPALRADPSVGFGINYIFGGDWSLGLRIFSDDQAEEVVGALGLDYVIGDQRVRPTAGIAYLEEDFYVGFDIGYDFNARGVDFSVGLGVVDADPAVAPAAPPPGGGGPAAARAAPGRVLMRF